MLLDLQIFILLTVNFTSWNTWDKLKYKLRTKELDIAIGMPEVGGETKTAIPTYTFTDSINNNSNSASYILHCVASTGNIVPTEATRRNI